MSEAGDDAAGEEPKRKKMSGKKLVLFIVLPLLLLLGGGGAAAFFLLGGEEPEAAAEAGENGEGGEGAGGESQSAASEGDGEGPPDDPNSVVFYDLPELLVNLNTGERKQTYLKLGVALELKSSSGVSAVETVLPRVIDRFQIYLRELRVEDLNGSIGMVRLKEELLVRINAAIGSDHVRDILFKDILVQ